jgi:hypothetical protein
MLFARGTLYRLFGLETSVFLDALAVGFLVYAGALTFAARRQPINRSTLMAFTIADALWVGVSAVVLLTFWSRFTPIAQVLIIATALIVEVFATLQFRAAGRASG